MHCVIKGTNALFNGYEIERHRAKSIKMDEISKAMYSSSTTKGRGKCMILYDDPISITHPDLVAEWSEKNLITPNAVTAGSHELVWWKGKCGHEWQTRISNRALRGSGCPYCTTRATLKGFNDLVTLRSDLVAEWNYEKNGDLNPEDFRPFARKKVWWRCKNGHEWQASLNSRAKGCGCRICSNKVVLQGFNDLASKRPDLAAEWSDRNLPVTPESIIWRKTGAFWWNCSKCGNEYKVWLIDRIVRGSGCPYCAGYKIKAGYNDLKTTDPEIAKDWDYDSNAPLLPESYFRRSLWNVNWKCSNGHSYAMKIYDRTVCGKGCIICETRFKASFSEMLILLWAKRDGVRYEFGTDKGELFLPESSLAFEAEGVSIEKKKAQRKRKSVLKKQGITLTVLPRSENLEQDAIKVKNLLRRHGVSIKADIKADIEALKKDFFGKDYRKGPYTGGGEFKDVLGPNIRSQSIMRFVPLSEGFPELAEEWSEKNFPFKFEDEDARSTDKVWWKCKKCGSEWKGIVRNRTSTRRSGCHVCAGKRIDIGINDLRTTHPEICEEWSPRNVGILPEQFTHGSNTKVWWQCKNGHEWQALICTRARGNGCPVCARLPLVKGENDLLTTNPEVIEIWSDKNGDLKPEDIRASFSKQVWWKCKQCGNEFLAQPRSVIDRNRTGCKRCQSTIGRYWKGILTEEEKIKEEYR